MKRFIINIMLFFAIVASIDICIGFTGDYLQTYAKGGMTRETNDLVMKDSHDVLIFGSSRAKHHYDAAFLTDSLGLDVYNAGYDGNGVVLSYGLLSLILERYQPKLVLLDIEPAFDIYDNADDNNNKRYIRVLKPYYQNTVVGTIIKGVSTEEWYKLHSGMIRYNTVIINKAKDFVISTPISNQGFVPLKGELKNEPKKSDNQTVVQIDEFKLACLENMIQMAQSKNVSIATIVSPRYGSQSSKALTPAFDVCHKYDVPVLDYYTYPLFMQHREWFKEAMHLNAAGAHEYSKIVAADIISIVDNNN